MNLTIRGHHLEVTPFLREHVQSKLAPVLLHFEDHITIIVFLSIEDGGVQQVKVILRTSNRKEIVVEEKSNEMYGAITETMARLDRAVLAHKRRLSRRRLFFSEERLAA
jgi:putative sigma-54 modulation protein